MRRYAERLEALHLITRAILAASSPEDVARGALYHVRQLLHCRRASVVIFDPEAKEASILAVSAEGEAELKEGLRFPLEYFCPPGRSLEEVEVTMVEDIEGCGAPSPLFEGLRREGIRSFLRVSLLSEGKVIGALNLGRARRGRFSEEDVETVREVAALLSLAIEQARLREQLRGYASQLEDKVSEQTAELKRVNAELEAFVYSISHDLRAPLRAIQVMAQALLEEGGGERELVERMAAAAERMDRLIADLLAYSRLSRAPIVLGPVDLRRVVEEALDNLQVEVQERGAQIQVEGPLPKVRGHHSTLVQVVSNLLSNGIKFVPPGTRPEVRVWASREGERVRLFVQDNGIGIPKKEHKRIFEIFERLHSVETYPGTGMGLAIVRRGVQKMGGKVGVESAPGRGSRFWVELQRL